MTVEEILDLMAADAAIVICEPDGKPHYTGMAHRAHVFDAFDIGRINVVDNRLIITIQTNDMLD